MAKMTKRMKTKPTKQSSNSNRTNPLLNQQQTYLTSLSQYERDNFFSTSKIGPDRRAELWMEQADLGEALVNQYAWATPDDRAIRILNHFAPLVEIGCGANAYWCQIMKAAGIDIVGYDKFPEGGGTIHTQQMQEKNKNVSNKNINNSTNNTTSNNNTKNNNNNNKINKFPVKQGGPNVLANFKDRTLFLCYADEDISPNDTDIDNNPDTDGGESTPSMGATCLDHYKGQYVIHVGELFGDTLSMEQAPWGRSSSPDFQDRLAAEYHCMLKASLTNWLHVRDTISVWKRSQTCTIVFAADDDKDNEEEEEEVEYKHIPVEERLPTDIAAPCLQHLLASHNTSVVASETPSYNNFDDAPDVTSAKECTESTSGSSEGTNSRKQNSEMVVTSKAKKQKVGSSNSPEKHGPSDYLCPW